jgi:hypothetical protein
MFSVHVPNSAGRYKYPNDMAVVEAFGAVFWCQSMNFIEQ